MLPKTNIFKVLESFKDPILAQSYPELGWARLVGDSLRIRLGYPATQNQQLVVKASIERLLSTNNLHLPVEVVVKIARHKAQADLKPQSGIKNVIAIGSGKGGVGKSTVAANIALALSKLGCKVGVLDADIYGPSQPAIFGLTAKPEVKNNKFIPLTALDISVLSMGSLVEDKQAMIWRGPMVSGALTQLFQETAWPDLDYLILDLPPGTGDIQLTMAQKLPIAGAVVVTTPQDLSLLDANKAISMFEKVNIPVLGLIENMSTYVCSHCGHIEPLFGADGAIEVAKKRGLLLMGQVPLARAISYDTEQGIPTVAADAQSPYAQIFIDCAQKIAAQLAMQPAEYQLSVQTIKA